MKKNYKEIDFKNLPLRIQKIINEILDREGGYNNHENDHETKWGIRKLSADRAGYTGRIIDLDRYTAGLIWTSLFWYGPNIHTIDKISPLIAQTVLDTSGPAGFRVGIEHLQKSLTSFNLIKHGERIYGVDLTHDGVIGPKTLDQLERFLLHRSDTKGDRKLATRLNCLQDAHYCNLAIKRPNKRSFSYGWTSQRVYADLIHLAETDLMMV